MIKKKNLPLDKVKVPARNAEGEGTIKTLDKSQCLGGTREKTSNFAQEKRAIAFTA